MIGKIVKGVNIGQTHTMESRYHHKSRLPGQLAAAILGGAAPAQRACLHQAGESHSNLLAGDYPRPSWEARIGCSRDSKRALDLTNGRGER